MKKGNDVTQKVVYPLDTLRVAIDKIIRKKIFKDVLWRDINEEFEKKGLNSKSLQLLLDDDKKSASDLKNYELIAFSKIAYKKLEKEEFDPKRYFGDTVLISYESNVEKKEFINKIILRNFIKIDEFNYRGQISYRELYDYLNNDLIIYDHNAQRSPKYREVGSKNGKTQKLKVVNLNMETVEDIADAILDEVFEDSEIILNCEMLDEKTQKFKFIDKHEDVFGDILIEPDYDLESNETTWLTIPDGYHRCRGIILAMNRYYAKEGVWLDGSIGVRLVRATKERAKRIVYQTFLRSPDEPEWVNTLDENDYTKFVDMIVKNSKRLSIENTVEEAEINEKLTSKSLLVDIFKKTDIEVNDTSKAFFKAKSIAKNFDIIYDTIKNEVVKINPYSIAGYIYISYLVREDMSKLFDTLEFVKFNERFNNMCRKNVNINNFTNLIDELISEVIDNG